MTAQDASRARRRGHASGEDAGRPASPLAVTLPYAARSSVSTKLRPADAGGRTGCASGLGVAAVAAGPLWPGSMKARLTLAISLRQNDPRATRSPGSPSEVVSLAGRGFVTPTLARRRTGPLAASAAATRASSDSNRVPPPGPRGFAPAGLGAGGAADSRRRLRRGRSRAGSERSRYRALRSAGPTAPVRLGEPRDPSMPLVSVSRHDPPETPVPADAARWHPRRVAPRGCRGRALGSPTPRAGLERARRCAGTPVVVRQLRETAEPSAGLGGAREADRAEHPFAARPRRAPSGDSPVLATAIDRPRRSASDRRDACRLRTATRLPRTEHPSSAWFPAGIAEAARASRRTRRFGSRPGDPRARSRRAKPTWGCASGDSSRRSSRGPSAAALHGRSARERLPAIRAEPPSAVGRPLLETAHAWARRRARRGQHAFASLRSPARG